MLLNKQERTVLVFDSLGRQSALVGGQGEGPGSVSNLGAAFLFGDTLAVFDNNRRKVYLFVQGKLVAPSLDFSRWSGGEEGPVRLVGRFDDGRWLALQSRRQLPSPGGAHEYTDTSEILAGLPGAMPGPFLQLPLQQRVRAVQGNSSYLMALYDVAPSYVSVCDSGVVVLDSSAVRYTDRTGREIAKIDVRHAKVPFQSSRRDEALATQLFGMTGPVADDARKLLNAQLDGVSRVVPPARLDWHGQLWLSRGVGFERFDNSGKFDVAFTVKGGVLAIGDDRALVVSRDRSTDLLSYTIYRSRFPAGLLPASLGWCQGMSVW